MLRRVHPRVVLVLLPACPTAGEPTDPCPADGTCMNLEALQDESLACCGF